MDENEKPESVSILSSNMLPFTIDIENAFILRDLLIDTLQDIEKYNIIENLTKRQR